MQHTLADCAKIHQYPDLNSMILGVNSCIDGIDGESLEMKVQTGCLYWKWYLPEIELQSSSIMLRPWGEVAMPKSRIIHKLQYNVLESMPYACIDSTYYVSLFPYLYTYTYIIYLLAGSSTWEFSHEVHAGSQGGDVSRTTTATRRFAEERSSNLTRLAKYLTR